jgi:hypothetical protein
MDRRNPQGLARALELTTGDGSIEAAPMKRLKSRRDDQIERLPNGFVRGIAEDSHTLTVPTTNDSVSIAYQRLVPPVAVF